MQEVIIMLIMALIILGAFYLALRLMFRVFTTSVNVIYTAIMESQANKPGAHPQEPVGFQ